MLELKEKNYFEELITRKMQEAVEMELAVEALKVDENKSPADPMDQATLDSDRHIAILLLEKKNTKIEGFKYALERIREGTYGICEGCDEMISRRRLKIIPFARFCVSCQSKYEVKMMEGSC
ncbi:MAG: TraR/DksA C4-type zinc finger protein [Deltaproteobacteria bacterium]|nr:TraR/DksA C4-type zinc finger protein [Deltaproteobacteria bacterium]